MQKSFQGIFSVVLGDPGVYPGSRGTFGSQRIGWNHRKLLWPGRSREIGVSNLKLWNRPQYVIYSQNTEWIMIKSSNPYFSTSKGSEHSTLRLLGDHWRSLWFIWSKWEYLEISACLKRFLFLNEGSWSRRFVFRLADKILSQNNQYYDQVIRIF